MQRYLCMIHLRHSLSLNDYILLINLLKPTQVFKRGNIETVRQKCSNLMTAHNVQLRKSNVGQPWIKGLPVNREPWICDSMILLFRVAGVFLLSYPLVFSSSKSLAISFISVLLSFSAFSLNEAAELKARAKPTRDNRIKVFITSPNPNFWFKENRIELLYSLGRSFKCVDIVKIICWLILTKKKMLEHVHFQI